MVMGGDSRSKGCGFESQRWMDMTFFTLICCNNCIVCLKRPKINEKEAGVCPIFLKKLGLQFQLKPLNFIAFNLGRENELKTKCDRTNLT